MKSIFSSCQSVALVFFMEFLGQIRPPARPQQLQQLDSTPPNHIPPPTAPPPSPQASLDVYGVEKSRPGWLPLRKSYSHACPGEGEGLGGGSCVPPSTHIWGGLAPILPARGCWLEMSFPSWESPA